MNTDLTSSPYSESLTGSVSDSPDSRTVKFEKATVIPIPKRDSKEIDTMRSKLSSEKRKNDGIPKSENYCMGCLRTFWKFLISFFCCSKYYVQEFDK